MRKIINKLLALFGLKPKLQPWPVVDDPLGDPEWWNPEQFDVWGSHLHHDDAGWERADDVLAAIGQNLICPTPRSS
jgi:hypothetical protein